MRISPSQTPVFSRPSAAAEQAPKPPPLQPGAFTGFDEAKLAGPLKLQDDGQPKSAKYTFAKLAQDSGVVPQSKAEAEAWFNQYIKPGMEAAGFAVGWVKGDKALIATRENPEGEVIDFVRAAGSGDPSQIALAWQPEGADPGGMSLGGVQLQSRFAPQTGDATTDEEQVSRDLIERLRALHIQP